MEGVNLVQIVAVVLVSGLAQSVATTLVMKTSIRHMEKDIERIEKSAGRAHQRIDDMQRGAI